jgi:hypothetical protein
MCLSATIQTSSAGRAGRLDAKRVPMPRMQAVEFQGSRTRSAKVLAGGYVSGEWSLLGTRYLAFKTGGKHWVGLKPRCTAEGCRKQEFGSRDCGNGDVGGMQRVAVQTGVAHWWSL